MLETEEGTLIEKIICDGFINDRYEIGEFIGWNVKGEMYQAWDVKDREYVAVRIVATKTSFRKAQVQYFVCLFNI